MPLTKEQFTNLYSKGLTVDQIVAFERGETPQTLTPPKQEGFFSRLVNDPFKTLIATPAIRTGQMLAAPIVNRYGTEEQKQRYLDLIKQDVQVPGIIPGSKVTVEGQKPFGEGGGRQIVGEAAKTASYLVGGGGTASAVRTGLTGQITRSALTQGGAGLVSGGAYSFGDSIQKAENEPAKVAFDTLFGAGVGLTTGLVFGAATPLVVKTANGIRKFTSVQALNEELKALNRQVLKPSPKIQEKWKYQKVDPVKTYTEIFSTDVPDVDKNNRFIPESIDEFIERVDQVYRPGAEGFNTILRNSPETNSLSQRMAKSIENLRRSNLKDSQIEQGIAKIQAEFDAVKRAAARDGVLVGDDLVPVWYSDVQKDRFWGATKNFGSEESTLANEVNRSIGNSFKEGIEEVVDDINVKNFNKQLQELIVLKDYLDGLRGKNAGTGGRATRLITRAIGAVAGSGGGPVGSTIGAITGDQLAQIWINPANQPQRWIILKALQRLPPAQRQTLEQEANEVIQKMFQNKINKIPGTLELPPPSYIPLPAQTPPPSGVRMVPAQKGDPGRDKSGKFIRTYLSGEKSQ
jgi:hypothetical protein